MHLLIIIICPSSLLFDNDNPLSLLARGINTLKPENSEREVINYKDYIHVPRSSSTCTITSKINGTPKGVYLPISKLHSILALANLLAHNNL